MSRLLRLMIVALLAAFAAGTVVHAANGAAMTVEMAAMQMDEASASGCDDCSADDDGALSCDIVCVTPLLATISADGSDAPVAGALGDDLGHQAAIGRRPPPDSSPPRPSS